MVTCLYFKAIDMGGDKFQQILLFYFASILQPKKKFTELVVL
jgi:hypothetical protein